MADPQPAPRKTLSPWLLILLFGAPFTAFVALLLSQGHSPGSIETRLSASPALRDTLAAFRVEYPADHADFLARAAAAANADGDADIEQRAVATLRAFLRTKADAIARAPSEDLHRVAGALAGLAGRLQAHDPQSCAQFVSRGAMAPARLPSEISAASGRVNALLFHAARRGERSPARPRGGLSRADVAAWVAQVETGPESADPAEVCARGVVLYRAAAELPEAQSANVTAYLVRASLGA